MADHITLLVRGRVESDPDGIIAAIGMTTDQALASVEATQRSVQVHYQATMADLETLHTGLALFRATITDLLTKPDPAFQAAADRVAVTREKVEAEAQRVQESVDLLTLARVSPWHSEPTPMEDS